MNRATPLLAGLAHGASDASAGLLVGVIIQQKLPEVNTLILLYNVIAFGLQPAAGYMLDRLNMARQGTALGLGLTAAGILLIQVDIKIAAVLIGMGSAFFHAGGGALSITASPGKASAPGIFAAFGVVGLALGGLGAFSNRVFLSAALIIILMILAAALLFTKKHPKPESPRIAAPVSSLHMLIVVLVLAVALRSTAWVGAQGEVERYSSAAVWVAIAAGSGKLMGGFAADRFGWIQWLIVAMAASFVLLGFGGSSLIFLIPGIFFLQSITPLSIAAAGKALPGSPALAASLVLGVGVLAGGLPFFFLTPGWFGRVVLAACVILSAVFYWALLHKMQSRDMS